MIANITTVTLLAEHRGIAIEIFTNLIFNGIHFDCTITAQQVRNGARDIALGLLEIFTDCLHDLAGPAHDIDRGQRRAKQNA